MKVAEEKRKTARETLKDYVKKAQMRTNKKFASLRQIAMEEPHEVGNALGELGSVFTATAAVFTDLAKQAENFKENLDLNEPGKTASLRERVNARKNYAATLRRIANEQPEELGSALSAVIEQLDEAAEAIETLADEFGLELNVEGANDMGDDAPAAVAAEEAATADEHVNAAQI